MEKRIVESILIKLKKSIKQEYVAKNWNNALGLINVAAEILYYTNIVYVDAELEKIILDIATQVEVVDRQDFNKENVDDKTVIFYDAFGLNNRGLAQIYLRALCKVKRVVYVTYKFAEGQIPDLINLIEANSGVIYYITKSKYIDQIKQLNDIIKAEAPKHFFFYAYPSDVVGTTIMCAYAGIIQRYQINLTDHAFWLGAQPIDICIDFRNYGASISHEYRDIPKEKIVVIPYYPVINFEVPFQGFPFEVQEGQKVVFSGGALYKTFGGENRYYKIVEYLLKNHEDVIFWYAGAGDTTEIDKIIKAYPERVYITSERNDLYQVLERCYFYLSTYPVCGGLMFQYVARAGKIPLTLRYDSITDDFLINQSNLDIQFDNIEDIYFKIDKLIMDSEYVREQELKMRNAVITEEEFNRMIANLFSDERSGYPIQYEYIDTSNFRKEYLDNITNKKINMLLVRENSKCVFKYMPLRFISGLGNKVINKLVRVWKKLR